MSEHQARPVIDGRPDEVAWQVVGWHDDFVQVRPETFATPSQRTEIAVLYDDRHLYVAARLHDSEPQEIAAQQWIQGRGLEMDDQFQIMLDTFGNRRTGYLFRLNPNGIRHEALVENEHVSEDWKAIWHGASWRDQHGWSVELAIPFASLNFAPGAGGWRINFGRIIRRNNEEIAWSTRGMDTWTMAPAVSGALSGLKLPDNGSATDVLVAPIWRHRRRGVETNGEAELAFDLFYRPSSALTLAATVNTDFSATEVDDRIVNLTRFSVFVPEKREFFLQDANIFEFEGLDSNGRPFFSRNIGLDRAGEPVRIIGGGKVTGRSGPWAYGLLGIRQDAVDAYGHANLAIARVQADVLDESRIGVIATLGAPDGNNASLYGLDFSYRNGTFLGSRLVTAKGWFQESREAGISDDNRFWGLGLAWPGEDLHVSFTRQVIEPNFNPRLGFVNRPNISQSFARGGYRFRLNNESLRSFEPWLVFNNIRNFNDGRLATRWLRFWPLSLYWHSGDHLEIWRDERIEVLENGFSISPGINIPSGRHRFSATALAYSTAPHRNLSGRISIEHGGFFDGKRRAMTGTLTWRAWSKLSLSSDIEIAALSLPSGDFTSRLFRFQSELALTPALSWTNTVQYDNLSTVLGIQSSMRWWPRAGQTLDVVFGRSVDEHTGLPSRVDATSLTIKYSHNFRF